MIPPLTRAVLHLGLSTTEAVLDRALTVVRLADTLLVAGARDNAAAGRGTSPWPAEDEGDLAAVSLRLAGDEETETPNTPARKTVAKAAARKTASKSTPRKTAAKTTARKAATTVTGTSTANKAAAARTTPAKTPGQNAAAAKTSAKKTPARSSAKAAATGAAKNAEKGRTPRQTTPRSEA